MTIRRVGSVADARNPEKWYMAEASNKMPAIPNHSGGAGQSKPILIPFRDTTEVFFDLPFVLARSSSRFVVAAQAFLDGFLPEELLD